MGDSILREIAEATALREGPAGVEALLRAVFREDGIRLLEAANSARLPLPVATAVRRELEKRGLLRRDGGLALTEQGRSWLLEGLGFVPPCRLEIPPTPQRPPAPLGAVVDALAARLRHAPPTDVTLDQAPCTAETAVRRAALLYRSGALEGRRVLLLGDDDSLSIAIGLLGKHVFGTALPRRLVVVEIDAARIAFLQETAREEGLAMEILSHDLREPLPASLSGAFDVFQTDPPYTLQGASLFLNRGVQALEGGRGQGMLSFGIAGPAIRLRLQALLVELGLAVTAIYTSFNSYGGATVLGSTSDLLELVSLGGREALLGRWEGPLYTAQVNPRARSYACRDCGLRVRLGEAGVPETIGALKTRGCSRCGGRIFDRARA